MTHPSEADLALFAGGDTGFLERWRTGKHVDRCARCSQEVTALRLAGRQFTQDALELPANLRWERLADEMTANIHVGIEAAECVGPVRRAVAARVDWRAAAVMAGMSLVLLGAWWLNPMPRSAEHAMRAPNIEIRTVPAGLELNQNGNAMVLMHGAGTQAQRTLIVSSPGLLRARYVDSDTGQITINHVYSQ